MLWTCSTGIQKEKVLPWSGRLQLLRRLHGIRLMRRVLPFLHSNPPVEPHNLLTQFQNQRDHRFAVDFLLISVHAEVISDLPYKSTVQSVKWTGIIRAPPCRELGSPQTFPILRSATTLKQAMALAKDKVQRFFVMPTIETGPVSPKRIGRVTEQPEEQGQ